MKKKIKGDGEKDSPKKKKGNWFSLIVTGGSWPSFDDPMHMVSPLTKKAKTINLIL